MVIHKQVNYMAEALRDPKDLQAEVEEFQRTYRQLSAISTQRQQIIIQIEELKMAQDYLKKTKESEVIFKAVGNLLIQSEKKGASKEIDDKLELFELREKTMKKQEDSTREKLESMRKKLEAATSQGPSASS